MYHGLHCLHCRGRLLLFRQATLLLAVSAGKVEFQQYAIMLFGLPYLLFAAPAGWLADRFSKRRIVIGAKALEVAAMICGAIGVCTNTWGLMFAMVGLMGLQSAIFSPSLSGSIPELYPPSYVTAANAKLRVATTGAILLGIGLAGIVLDVHGNRARGLAAGRRGTPKLAARPAAATASTTAVSHRAACRTTTGGSNNRSTAKLTQKASRRQTSAAWKPNCST